MLKNISLVENTGTFTTRSSRLPQALERHEDGDFKPVRLTTPFFLTNQALTQLDVLKWWNERGASSLETRVNGPCQGRVENFLFSRGIMVFRCCDHELQTYKYDLYLLMQEVDGLW